ncbi:MAG: hypothetical protein ACLGHN_06650 [Bacteriovoracia bacterium]
MSQYPENAWDGRRVAKNVDGVASSRNIYEGSLQLSAVVAPDGSIKEYVYGTNINSPDYMKVGAATYRIIKDHLGSPRLVVNATDGTISQRVLGFTVFCKLPVCALQQR